MEISNKAIVPTKKEVKAARVAAGLTQAQAAELIFKGWQVWALYESGKTKMDAAYWQLFNLKLTLKGTD